MGTGINVLHVSAGGVSAVNGGNTQGIYDALDVTYPWIEGNTIFVSATTTATYGETRGTCVDNTRPCSSAAECITALGETCPAGFCSGPNWCPPTGYTPTVTAYNVWDHYLVWMQGDINFYMLSGKEDFSSVNSANTIAFPAPGANTFTLSDFMTIAGIQVGDIKVDGAIMKVTNSWKCSLTGGCSPTIEATRVDIFPDGTILGCNEARYYYYQQNNNEYRNLFNSTGLKIIFENKGVDSQFSYQAFILQFCAFLVIFKFAHIPIDWYLSLTYGERFNGPKTHRMTDLSMVEEPIELEENKLDGKEEEKEDGEEEDDQGPQEAEPQEVLIPEVKEEHNENADDGAERE
jgi:hypothetical protein